MPDTNPIQYPAPQADISCFPQAYSANESAEIFELLKTDLDWQQAHITLYRPAHARETDDAFAVAPQGSG